MSWISVPACGACVGIRGASDVVDPLAASLGLIVSDFPSCEGAPVIDVAGDADTLVEHCCLGVAEGDTRVQTLADECIRVYTPGGCVDMASAGGSRVRFTDRIAPKLRSAVEIALIRSLALQGGMALHAAALEVDGLGVLLVGSSCSGKSTFALAGLSAQAQVLSDDALVAFLDPGHAPMLYSLRPDLVLRKGSLPAVPNHRAADAEQIEVNGETKWRLSTRSSGQPGRTSLSPDALLLAGKFSGTAQTRITRVDSSFAFSRLLHASNPLFFSATFHRERTACTPVAKALACEIPAFAVELGTALMSDPREELVRIAGEVRRLAGLG